MSVGRKLSVIVATFVIAFAAVLLQTAVTLSDESDHFVVVDVLGRQRSLNERYMRSAVLSSIGMPDQGTLEATERTLEQSVEAMIHGGNVTLWVLGQEVVREVHPAFNAQIRSSLLEQQNLLREVIAASRPFSETRPDDPLFAERLAKVRELNEEFDEKANEAVKLTTASLEALMDGLVVRSIVVGLLAVCIAGAIGLRIARSISVSLKVVVERAQQVGRGDLTGDPLALTTHDEIGALALGINEMVEGLRSLASRARDVMTRLSTTMSQVQSSVQEQSAASQQIASSVQEITSTVHEITQSGSQISDRAKTVASSAEQSAAANEVGRVAVGETTQDMDSIRRQVEDLAENIVTLSEKTQAIEEIIGAVSDIAEQSNLLALNAAIESVSAGDHGARFSVVASEMKNLADRAKTSTVQVRGILGDIQKGIGTSVMLTEETVKRVEVGKVKADTAQSTIARMTEMTRDSTRAFQEILGSTNQQQIGFDQVFEAMEDLRRACEQSAIGTSQLEEAASSLTDLGVHLAVALETYKV